MARVSKKTPMNQVSVNELLENENIYKTAIYARLSNEDLGKKDGGSIDNQILLVQKYIESKPYLKLCDTFIDNGETGTNFDRDGWRNLMEAVQKRKIDCIAVKDLSRLGRDYIETGNYIENIFPFLGVRFISVNDNYDSQSPSKNGDNLTIVLKNLVNDMYAKDISKKIRSAFAIKHKKGEYTGGHAPYGYVKSAENRYKLVIDEEAAQTVKDIFQWKLDGLSNKSIVRRLNDNEILSPSNYCYKKNLLTHEKFSKKILWNDVSVSSILKSQVYIGHLIQGRRKSDLSIGMVSKIQPKENWITAENTHKPIIESEIFEEVQKIIACQNEKYFHKLGESGDRAITGNIFVGLVYCGDCGRSLTRTYYVDKYKKKYWRFVCPTYTSQSSKYCSKKNVFDSELKNIVFSAVKRQCKLLLELESNINKINSSLKIKNQREKLICEKQELEHRINKIKTYKNAVYEDFKDGIITEREYDYARKKYEDENNLLNSRLNEIAVEINKYSEKFTNETDCFYNMKAFSENSENAELSREMLVSFIEKIIIYSGNLIEIKFKYKDEIERLQRYIDESEASA